MSGDDPLVRLVGDRARARAGDARSAEAGDARGDGDADAILAALERAPRAPAAQSRPRGARVALLAAPLAAAAAIALLVTGRGSHAPVPIGPYVVSVSGHVLASRGEADAPRATLETNARAMQEVVLRPEGPPTAPVTARVLVVRDGVARPYDVTPEVSDRGSVRFDAPSASLLGASALRVVVAPPAVIDDATARARDGATVVPSAWVAQIPIEKND